MTGPLTIMPVIHRAQATFSFSGPNFTLHFTNALKTLGPPLDPANPLALSLFEEHNGRPFSTVDRDKDSHASLNCATDFGWYSSCWNGSIGGHGKANPPLSGAYFYGDGGTGPGVGFGWIYLK